MSKKPGSRLMFWVVLVVTVLSLALTVWALVAGSSNYAVLNPKGPIAEGQRDVIIISTILTAIVIVPTTILTFVIVWRYRDKPGRKAKYDPDFNHSNVLESIWWGIPIVVIAVLGIVTVRYTYALEPSVAIKSDKPPVVIQAISLDWKWAFFYPEEGVATVNTLTIPEDRPIRFELTSDAPMNSFWIPQLGGQIYTMSGMAMNLYLQADHTGTYYGSGANFSGEHFGDMNFDVNAVTESDYEAWVKKVKTESQPMTLDTYESIATPGTADKQYFSSFPEGLFQKIVTQYLPGGLSEHRKPVHTTPAMRDQGI
ncbi:cytochrome aa3 quinol oxidase subunit II [Paenibacillus campi]|uniref:cytochrome aa3 quinol oxidase subunit II n=1 Tax=Paenibacillus campi TaxID=3106031 RepID=UPI002AFFB5CC|nr:cytochrome aa3 quinol oxidase subunit II [Paenibacillus sp. SGZ-1014]